MSRLFRHINKMNPFTWQGKLFVGHERTVRINRHVIATFMLQSINIVVGLMLVPLIIHYVNPTQYGIWITLSSIISWIAVFDGGLGNGLRNKLAEALAKGDEKLARYYISTTYASLAMIMGGIYLLFLGSYPFLSWVGILNADPDLEAELSSLVFVVFTMVCLQFIIRLIINILYADQRPAWNSLVNMVSNVLSLLIIYMLTLTTKGSILYLGSVMTGVPVIVLLVVSVFLFSGRYKKYAPSIKFVDLIYFRELFGLGARFFVMQIFALIILSTDYIIITQLFGPAEVTPYNVAYKYFGIVSLVFISIILTPYWSAFTDAFTKKEFNWIQDEVRKLLKIWSLLIIVVLVMVAVSNHVYDIWIGEVVKVPFVLSALMGLFVIIFTLNSLVAGFIGGSGKIQLRMYILIFAGALNIPLSIFLAKYLQMGIAGVICATNICFLIDAIVCYVQYQKLVSNSANGIWDK